MSTPDINYGQQFEDTFHLLAQTQGARLSPYMRNKEFTNAESVSYEQMAAITEDEQDTRYARTNYKNIDTFRRRLTVDDKVVAVQIDQPDEKRTLADIRNPNIRQLSQAWKRSKDISGIKGALGTTIGGKNGEVSNTFDWTNQKVSVSEGSTAATGLNIDKLIEAKGRFWANDIDVEDPMYQLHMAVTGDMLQDLLRQVQVTSADYNSVRALVNGEVDTFMGIKFHRSELIPYMKTSGDDVWLDWQEDATYKYAKPVNTDSTNVRCGFVWAEDMVCVATNKGYKFRAEELQDYNYNFGLFAQWGVGSMRQEEKGVVAVPCDFTANDSNYAPINS